jgi:hypothetical protein
VDEVMLRAYLDGEGDMGDLVMYEITRDDDERVKDGWTSTG